MDINVIMERERIKIEMNDYVIMKFLFESLEKDWKVKKRNNKYIIRREDGDKYVISRECIRRYCDKNEKWNEIDIGENGICEIKVKKRDDDGEKKIEIEKEIVLMGFLYNALEEGWNIKKKLKSYIFTKKHQNKREIFMDDYLASFLERNFNLQNILKD